MMKNLIIAITIAFAATAMPNAAAAETKIGVVNLRALMAEAPMAEEVRSRLESEFAPQQRELQSQQSDLQSLNEKMQRDGETMSSSEMQSMQRRIRDLERDLQRSRQQLMEDARMRQQEEMQGLQQAMVQQVQRFGEREGFDLILVDGVAYASEAIDVTEQVLAQMQAE